MQLKDAQVYMHFGFSTPNRFFLPLDAGKYCLNVNNYLMNFLPVTSRRGVRRWGAQGQLPALPSKKLDDFMEKSLLSLCVFVSSVLWPPCVV